MMIPIIFIVQEETWNKRTVLFTLLVVFALFFIDQFTNLLDDALSGTQYKNVFTDIKQFANNGTNFFRVLVYSVPAIMSFIFRKTINSDAPQLITLSANMCIVSAGLYFVSMFTSGIFLGRLPIYCSLFGYIFLPWLRYGSKSTRTMTCGILYLNQPYGLAYKYYKKYFQRKKYE